jgi:hypothetical protein
VETKYLATYKARMRKQAQKQANMRARMFLAPTASNGAEPSAEPSPLPYDDALTDDPDHAPDVCGPVSVCLRKFIKTATVYGIDAATAPDGGADTAAAFKQAAVDLVENSLQGAGIRRARPKSPGACSFRASGFGAAGPHRDGRGERYVHDLCIGRLAQLPRRRDPQELEQPRRLDLREVRPLISTEGG